MKKIGLFLLVAALLILTNAGCSSGKGESQGPASSGQPTEFVVSTFGFNEDLLRKNVFEPFEKANNVKIVLEVGNNADRLNKVRMKAHQVDVILLEQNYALQGVKEGLFEKIDRSKIPNLENLIDIAKAPLGEDYGPAYTVASLGIAYDKSVAKQPVKSYADLWREDFKGKVALPDITTTSGPMTLDFASKVAGAKEFDADKAFDKLKELRPNVVKFYSKSSDLANMFSQGEVAIAPALNFAIATIKKANPNVEWVIPEEGAYAVIDSINIVKGTKNLDLAHKFIDWWLSEEVQKANALDKVDSPVNKKVRLTPQEAEGLTYGEEMIKKLNVLDWEMVNDNMKTWIDRWNREIVAQ